MTYRALLLLGSTMVLATPAHAYLGPGMGAGTLAVVFGIFASIFLGLFAVIWYPLKRRLRRGREARLAAAATGPAGTDDTSPGG